jgi:steroid delta-isomerase-like uncharacterized protein
MSEANRMMGMHFFNAQDELRGGPDPALCAPGYTAKINDNAMDLAGHTAYSAGFYGAFSDANHIVEDTVADDEKVAVRFTIHGTHDGNFMGLPATGKKIALECMAVLWIEHGKVTELRALFDGASLMKQLGAG